MRIPIVFQLALAATILAQNDTAPPVVPSPAGTGPYTASWTTDPSLPSHVIYAPINPPKHLKMPVMVWGQGACSYNANTFDLFLKEVASHGFFILSNGLPNGPGNPDGMWETSNPRPYLHMAGLDWVTKYAGKGKFKQVDGSRVAAAGMSCGGIQAYAVQHDPRVTALGIFNSGLKNESYWDLAYTIKKPYFIFLGGPTDIAYVNGERDYTRVPDSTPKWKGNLDVGHGGDYDRPNGGKFAVAASNWLKWVLRGDSSVKPYFVGNGPNSASKTGWTVEHESLNKLKVPPLGKKGKRGFRD